MSEDIHALVGAYALGAVDEVERASFESHLAQCADCQEELPGMTAAVARLGGAHAVTPPAQLRSSVMAKVARTRQLAPRERSDMARHPRWSSLVSIAAALALVAGAFGLVVQQQRLSDERNRADRITAVASDPTKRTTTLPVVGGGTAELTSVRGAALVSLRGMPTLSKDQTYQLWKKLPDDTAVSLGVMGANPTKTMFVDGLGDSTALAVTVEKAGGAKQPTRTPTLVLAL